MSEVGWYYDGMARAARAGIQPSEYRRMTPGTVRQLLPRIEKLYVGDMRAGQELIVEVGKAIMQQVAAGDQAVIRQLGHLGEAIVQVASRRL